MFKKTAVALMLSTTLVACNGGEKETGGQILGAIAGAAIGSQFGKGTGQLVGVAVGTLAGAWVGGKIGESLDNADKAAMQKTTQNSLENNQTGQTSTWSNPDSGHSGTVTPTKTYVSSGGNNCREYTQTVMIGGKEEQAYGTACRQDDGSWKVVN